MIKYGPFLAVGHRLFCKMHLALFKGTLKELLQHPKQYKEQWVAYGRGSNPTKNITNTVPTYQNNAACVDG